MTRLKTTTPLQPSDEVEAEALRRATQLADGLYPHQVEGLAFLLGRRRAILADDMGLGKTRQSILAMQEAAPQGPWLVVCPASVKRNWAREIQTALGGEQAITVVGAESVPTKSYSGWVVINYNILTKHLTDLKKLPWAGLIFDEAHYLKNHTSQRSKNCRSLVDTTAGDPAIHCLTGTPMTNRPRDLFPLLQIVKHPMARSFMSFAKKYCDAYNNRFGLVTDGASNLDELSTQLHGVMLRRRKDDVLNLPPKFRRWLEVDVPLGTAANEMRNVIEMLINGVVDQQAAGHSAVTNKRANHDRIHLLALLTKVRQKVATAKVKPTIEYVQGVIDQGEKAIVFTGFDTPAKELHKAFGDEAVLLTGSTPADRRQELVDRFQNDPGVKVFVSNLVAGGTGITLTAATQVVFNDLDWVPAHHWQAEDRAYRIGQTKTVNVTYMVATDTVDAFVQQALAVKTKLVETVVDGEHNGELGETDILRDLESALRQLSPGLADASVVESDDPKHRNQDWAKKVLEAAGDHLRNQFKKNEDTDRDEVAKGLAAEHPALTPEILRSLAQAITGPQVRQFEFPSSRDPSTKYVVSVSGGDIDCTCPGFQYRGTCRHVLEVKNKLALK